MGVVTSVSAGIVAAEVILLAKKEGWLDKLRGRMQKKHRVLLLGSTGTGKTNLKNSLMEIAPKAISRIARTEFSDSCPMRIRGNPFVFVDTPGQYHRKSQRLRTYEEETKKDVEGIINVVSYGYHEGLFSTECAVKLDNSVNTRFLTKRRQREKDLLTEWVAILGGISSVQWVITVVNKADLWWDNRYRVLSYYKSGAYRDIMKRGAIPEDGVVVDYCSVIHKFYNRVPIAKSFDESIRSELRENLMTQLLAAIGRSS